MRTLTHSTVGKPKKQGRYGLVEEAVQQKQADLLKKLAGVDLTQLSETGQPTD